jgi:hypothetical protein
VAARSEAVIAAMSALRHNRTSILASAQLN